MSKLKNTYECYRKHFTNIRVSGRGVFKIKSAQVEIQLSDNTGAEIPPEKFGEIVKKFQNSGCFLVNINILKEGNDCPFVSGKVNDI